MPPETIIDKARICPRLSVRRTRIVYDRDGAGERLVHDVFEGGHQWHGTEALPFLDRWLGRDRGAAASG